MCRVTGDEYRPRTVRIGNGKAQFPEADVIDVDGEPGADGAMQAGGEIEVLAGGAGGHGRVKEPGLAEVDPSEELPVAAEIRVQTL